MCADYKVSREQLGDTKIGIFVTKIVLTYCEKKIALGIEKNF